MSNVLLMSYLSLYIRYSCFFVFFYLNIPIVLWFDYPCPICHILIYSFILFSCLTNVLLVSIHRIFFYLNIPIVLWSDYLCPICHILIFHSSYFSCLTHIFRETECSHVCHISPSAIFASCGLLFVRSHSRRLQPLSTIAAYSCCMLPPPSPPPPLPALLLPSSTIEATHCQCPVATHSLPPVSS